MEYLKKLKDAIFENKTISDTIDTVTNVTSRAIVSTANGTIRLLETSREHSKVTFESFSYFQLK